MATTNGSQAVWICAAMGLLSLGGCRLPLSNPNTRLEAESASESDASPRLGLADRLRNRSPAHPSRRLRPGEELASGATQRMFEGQAKQGNEKFHLERSEAEEAMLQSYTDTQPTEQPTDLALEMQGRHRSNVQDRLRSARYTQNDNGSITLHLDDSDSEQLDELGEGEGVRYAGGTEGGAASLASGTDEDGFGASSGAGEVSPATTEEYYTEESEALKALQKAAESVEVESRDEQRSSRRGAASAGAGDSVELTEEPDSAGTKKLRINNAAFCTQVASFGVVSKFPKNEFRRDQELLLYCELEHFVSQENSAGFETRLQGKYEIVDKAGQRLYAQELPEDQDICTNLRRDFYIAYRIYTPRDIEPGEYQMRLTIQDIHGGTSGITELAFRIAR